MSSQFHERLRAARKTANLTQQQMAKALGITRSAYAFYEFSADKGQTRPNVDQVRVIAAQTGVPVELLLDDKLSTNDIVRAVVGGPGAVAAPPRPAAPVEAPPASSVAGLLTPALMFAVLSEDPSRRPAFEARAAVGPMPIAADYLTPRTAAIVLAEPSVDQAREALGRLLILEKLARRTLSKLLLIWSREHQELEALATAALNELGVRVQVVTSAEAAAKAVLALK